MTRFNSTTAARFIGTFDHARKSSPLVADSTSTTREIASRAGMKFFLSTDRHSGFAISTTGELVAVFSTVRGRGNDIMAAATANGAAHLDCFDGYLTGLYSRHGFKVTERFANWTPGQPDVVVMVLAA